MRRVKGTRVWGWGDDLELAGRNVQTYVSKRWKSATEECSIAIDGRNENIFFEITMYISKPEGVEELVNNLLDVALTKADKIYLSLLICMINFSHCFERLSAYAVKILFQQA